MRVFQVGEGAGFALESLAEFGPLGQVSGQGLDGYDAVQARVAALIHFAHTSSADQGENLIGSQMRARFQCHLFPIIPTRAATARERWPQASGALASGKRTGASDP